MKRFDPVLFVSNFRGWVRGKTCGKFGSVILIVQNGVC